MARQVRITYRTFGLPEPDPEVEPVGGGEWWIFSGMGTGLDGTIYAGLCDHRFIFRGALLIAYNPSTGVMRTVADMNEVCGQGDRDDLCGQTKMHTRIMPDSDGRLYLGLHSVERDYAPRELAARLTGGYPGGHWVRYDPAADVTEDLGIAVPGESLLGFTIDVRTHRLYATTHTSSLLVEYDIAAGRSEVIGSVGGFPTRVMECTAQGMVYTFDDEGRVIRFDPRSRELRTLDARLPGWEGDVNFLTSFATVLGLDGDTIYGITTAFVWEPRDPLAPVIPGRKREFRPGYAFAYDTQAGPDGRMRIVGPSGCDPTVRMSDAHLHHAIAMARGGDLLYVSPRRERPAHLVMIDVTGSSGHGGSPGKERLLDLGEMVGEGDEGYVETALAATTGLDGTVYFGGPRKSEKYRRDYVRWALIALADGSWL